MRKRPNDVEKLDRISSSVDADGEGNLTVGKNLEVDGKRKLNSLVSDTNPDGDILMSAKEYTDAKVANLADILYEYTAVFLDEGNLGINRSAKFYSSADIKQDNKTRTSRELYEKLLPNGSPYELSFQVCGYAKIEDTYYSLIEMTFGTSNIYLTYLDPAKGKVRHSHNFRYDTTSIWNVIRNIASPRKAN